MRLFCPNCNKEINPNRVDKRQFLCSRDCSNKWKGKQKQLNSIREWKEGKKSGLKGCGIADFLRKYLFDKYSSKCAICSWNEKNIVTNKSPLNVEHIDGDWKNNKEENLILLCPNCHSLTATYCSLNKGKGRPNKFRKGG